MPTPPPHRVVIAGGGVAGLEALIALRSLAGDRVEVTLLAPHDEFIVRALSVEDPFAHPAPQRYPIGSICSDHGARFARDPVSVVHRETSSITTQSGEELTYDSLLIAVGAHPVPAFPHTTTFRGMQDSEAMHGVIQDVEAGFLTRLAFVVPTGVSWPLPIYELALMTAERAYALDLDVAITIVTPESEPLGVFGRAASAVVDAALQSAGITVVTSAHVADVRDGMVSGPSGDTLVQAQRVVALPRLEAPRMRGLPHDRDGFLPVDPSGQVTGVSGVFAAGDGTTFPIKQGGIAAQQAGAAARSIAVRAGAAVAPRPFRPVLHAKLLTGTHATFLREAIAGGEGAASSVASDHALWWPPSKIAAPYLAPYLQRLDDQRGGEHRTPSARGRMS